MLAFEIIPSYLACTSSRWSSTSSGVEVLESCLLSPFEAEMWSHLTNYDVIFQFWLSFLTLPHLYWRIYQPSCNSSTFLKSSSCSLLVHSSSNILLSYLFWQFFFSSFNILNPSNIHLSEKSFSNYFHVQCHLVFWSTLIQPQPFHRIDFIFIFISCKLRYFHWFLIEV